MLKNTFAEYAIGGIQNRNKIMRVSDFKLNGVGTDCYRSIFLFAEDLEYYVVRTRSVIGFAGPHVADNMVFDFDGSDLDQVRKEVIKFCKHLYHIYEIPIEYLRIYYSGNKGFHIEIPIQCFSLCPQPSNSFWRAYKEMAKEISFGFSFVDTKIYESKRLFRMANTINSKSGLYKIPLSYNELETLNQTEIKNLARAPREVVFFPEEEMVEIHSLSELYEKWKNSTNKSKNGLSQLGSLLEGVAEGSRNDKAIQLTGLFIDKGFNQETTLDFLKMWNERNTPPLDDRELEYLVASAYKRYEKNDLSKFEIISLREAEGIYKGYSKNLDGMKITTGYPLIDKKIRGIVRGETCCILGKTGVGKSAFLQNIGLRHAKVSKEPVIMFSLEMPITGVFERTIQIETGLSGNDVENIYKTGDPDFSSRAELVFNEIPDFYTVTQSGLNLEKIKEIIRFAEKNVFQKSTGLVLIDYLGLVQGKGADVYQQISNVARGMKDLAKELNVPVVFLSQVNRLYSEYDELELGAARDSGAIDEASDFVLGLWKERESNTSPQKEVRLNLGIIKNRKGGTGKVELVMDKKTLQMKEYSN